jgi:hypothetical protein
MRGRRARSTSSARRYHLRPRRRRVRVLARRGNRELTYRGRPRTPLLLLVLGVAALTLSAIAGYPLVGSAALGLLVIAWIGFALRVVRIVPAGPGGDGPAPPGGAGVREPRRPRPFAPAGAAAMPIDDEEPPGRSAAVI